MTLEEFKTLKPGDKVKIIDTPVSKTKYGVEPMDKWCGKIMTIHEYEYHECTPSFIRMEEDPEEWNWYPWMIDKKVPGVITMEIPENGGKILTEAEVKIMLLEREFAEFREQIKDELTRLKSRIFDYMDEK